MAHRTRNFLNPRANQRGVVSSGFHVTRLQPVAGSTLPLDEAPLSAEFSAPLNPALVAMPRVNGETMQGGLSFSDGLRRVTFSPSGPLPGGATVVWDLGAFVAAAEGEKAANAFPAQWQTARPFAVVDSHPKGRLSYTDALCVQFSGQPRLSSLAKPTENGAVASGEWIAGPAPHEATFCPAAEWTGSATVELDLSAARSDAGEPMEGNAAIAWSVEDNVMRVASTEPEDGAVLHGATPLRLTFTEGLSHESKILVAEGGKPAEAEVMIRGHEIRVTPLQAWAPGAEVKVDLGGVASHAGVTIEGQSVYGYKAAVTFAQRDVVPASGSGIYAKQPLSIEFTEPVDAASLNAPTENGVAKKGKWTTKGTTATFTPESDWTPGATVVVDWLDARDAHGNPSATAGAAAYDVRDRLVLRSKAPEGPLLPDAGLQVAFNRRVDPNTLMQPLEAGHAVKGEWTFVGNAAQFTPREPWQHGARVTLDLSSVKAEDGIELQTPETLSWGVPVQLAYVSMEPAAGTILSGEKPISVTFNREPDPASLRMPTASGGQEIAGNWEVKKRVATFTPSAKWPLGEEITVDWGMARSADGMPLIGTSGASFTSIPSFSVIDFTRGQLKRAETITLACSRVPDVATIAKPAAQAGEVKGRWTLSGSDLIFTPAEDWPAGETVTLDYAGLKDQLGNPVSNPSGLTFDVAEKLHMIEVVTPEVSGADALELRFDGEVDPAKMIAPSVAGEPVPGRWAPRRGGVLAFEPEAGWQGEEIHVDWAGAASPEGVSVENPGVTTVKIGS